MTARCTHLDEFVRLNREKLPRWAKIVWLKSSFFNSMVLLATWDFVGCIAGLFGDLRDGRILPRITAASIVYALLGMLVVLLFDRVAKASVQRREAVVSLERMVDAGHIECVSCAYAYRGLCEALGDVPVRVGEVIRVRDDGGAS